MSRKTVLPSRREIFALGLGAAGGIGLGDSVMGGNVAAPVKPYTNEKTLVFFGSSNTSGFKSSTYGGEPGPVPAYGGQPYGSPATSYAGLLTAALKTSDPAWQVYNRSIGGTGLVQGLARFDTDVAPYRPSHVAITFHPRNDGYDTNVIMAATVALINKCRRIGATPILRGATPNPDYTATQYSQMKALNQQLDTLGCYRIEHFAGLEDGTGRWKNAATYADPDGLHPNDAGYQVMFNQIDRSIFTNGLSLFRKEPAAGAWQVTGGSGDALRIDVAQRLKSFTLFARIKGVASGGNAGRAFLAAYAQGDVDAAAPFRLRNAGTSNAYDMSDASGAQQLSGMSVIPGADATPHWLAIQYDEMTNKFAGYVDGQLMNSFTPGGAVTTTKTFTVGGRAEIGNSTPATGYSFADVGLVCYPMRAEQLIDMARTGRLPLGSLMFHGSMGASPFSGGLLPNTIDSTLYGVLGGLAWQAVASF